MSRSNTPRNHTFRDAPLTRGVLELEGEVVSDYLHVGSGIVDVVLTSDVGDLTDMIERILKGESLTSFASLNSMFSRPAHLLSRVGDRVVIPGSTIKGMVRTRLELSIPNACYIVDMQSRNYSQRYREIFKPDQRKRADRFPQVCPVCDLLGNTGLASRVEFSDFTLNGDWIDFVSSGSESYEVVKKGGKFSGRVTFKVKSPEELGMILWGFGIRSGGEQGRPPGEVQVPGQEIRESQVHGQVTQGSRGETHDGAGLAEQLREGLLPEGLQGGLVRMTHGAL